MRGDETKIIKKRESVQFLIFFSFLWPRAVDDVARELRERERENEFVAQQSGSTVNLCQTVDKPQIKGTVHRFHF